MPKRRRLPAPPLILDPYLVRVPAQGRDASSLYALACFLARRELLTGGGTESLNAGLQGRNAMLSLGQQDVRSWAHGLVLQLWVERGSGEELWASLTNEYFTRYDKGKPRRPTHLQSLYLQWSNDFSWPGLLLATRHQPELWAKLEIALERLDDPSVDRDMLSLALDCRQSISPWKLAFREGVLPICELLRLLPLLEILTFQERVGLLCDLCGSVEQEREAPDWMEAALCAAHVTFAQARVLSPGKVDLRALERVASLVLATKTEEFFSAVFVGSFRTFISQVSTLEQLMSAIRAEDPLQRIVFGPRPGQRWLESLWGELSTLIALR